jgi:hypothetical protein
MITNGTELNSIIDSTQSDSKKRSSHKYALKCLIEALNLGPNDDIGDYLTVDLSTAVEKLKCYLNDTAHIGDHRVSNIVAIIRNQLIHYTALDFRQANFEFVLAEYKEKLAKDSKSPIQHINEIYKELEGTDIKLSYVKSVVHWKFSKSKTVPISDKIPKVLQKIDIKFKMSGRLINAYSNYQSNFRANTRKAESSSIHHHSKELSEKDKRVLISNRASRALTQNNAPSAYLKNYFNDLSDISKEFQHAILEINSYKTTGIVAGKSANVAKKQRWKLKNSIPMYSSKATILNKFGREHRESRSADNFWESIGSFFSFQALPESPDPAYFKGIAKTPLTDEEVEYTLPSYSGLGADRTNVNFFSLLDPDLLHQFYQHCTYSNRYRTFTTFAKYLKTLLQRGRHSYFYMSKTAQKQAVDYLLSANHINNDSEFLTYINEYLLSIEDMKISAESDFIDNSESFDNINFILKRERPLTFLVDVYKKSQNRYTEDLSLQNKLIHARDTLTTHLQMYNPLRAASMVALTIPLKKGTLRPINTFSSVSEDGNVNKGASYQIVLDKNSLKNIFSANEAEYKANFPLSVEEDLHIYLNLRKSYLEYMNKTSEFLFIPTANQSDYKPEQGISADSLSKSYKNFITKHRPPGDYEFRPFGLHANRHIVATNYLREHPEQYVVVAEILHDKIETVLATYAHFSTSRGLASQENVMEGLMTNEIRKVA